MKQGDLIVLTKEEAKKQFKKLREKGFIVDLGRATGNIWTPGWKKKLTWMIKDFQENWIIEIL